MYDKQNLPKKLVKEIELIDLLNSFPHLVKPQDYKIKGVGATTFRMSHSDMSFSEYYEYLKNYSDIADIEIKSEKNKLLGKNKPLTIEIYDKAERDIYFQDVIDSSKIRRLISKKYSLAKQKGIERAVRSIEDGEYLIDKDLSLKKDEKFERKKYRYLFLYSTGKRADLKNCMIAYKLSKDEIREALKHKVWVKENNQKHKTAKKESGPKMIWKKDESYKRLILKRFDIYFTLDNLRKIVLKKA